MVKVLHVINDLRVGGTEHLLVNFVETLKVRYPEITSDVCVLGGRQDAYADYSAALPDAEYLGFSGRYRNPIESARIILKLRSLIRRLSPDIVHSYLWSSDIFAAFATMGLGVRHVAHIVDRRADRGSKRWQTRGKVALTGWLYKKAETRFVAVSEACRCHAVTHYRIPPERVVVAHNGVDISDFANSAGSEITSHEDRSMVLGALSNLLEEKGISYLIRAMAILPAGKPPIILLVAGDGRMRGELEALSRELGVSDRVVFLGSVASPPEFYRSIDAFVVPSVYAEGLPTTILEAMASHLPIVATDIGGATEAVRHGMEALIVPPKDFEAIASAIHDLCKDPVKRRVLGENGRRRVTELFTTETMARKIVAEVYTPLVTSSIR